MSTMTDTDLQAAGRRAPGRETAMKVVLYGAMVAWAIAALLPVAFMIVSAFKPTPQIFHDLRSNALLAPVLPTDVTLENFMRVFERTPFALYLFNSLFVASVTVAFSLLVNSMMAYGLSRLEWRGSRVMLALVIALLVVPFEAIAVPLLFVVNQLPWIIATGDGVALQWSWINSYHVQIIPFIADVFSIFLFYQFFIDIPRELDEAALMDGAGRFRIYWSIILPLSRPVVATVAILQFQVRWNDYLWPVMAVPGQDRRPLTIGITTFYTQTPDWGQILAYASLITIPVLIVFLIFQRWFIQSVVSSGVKG